MGAIAQFGGGARAAWRRLPGNARGMIWMTLAAASFAVHDACAKSLGQTFGVQQIVFMRYVTSLVLVSLVLWWWMGFGKLATAHPYMHAVRAIFTVVAQMFAYYALKHLPLADVTGIAFTRPLFVIVFAVVLLRETAGWRRWAAACVGFAGMALMVRPSAAGIDPAAGAAILSSLTFAATAIMVRRWSASESAVTWIFYYLLAGAIMGIPGAALDWVPPAPEHLWIVLLISVVATVAQLFTILAFTAGEASAVSPMDFTRLVYAAAIGFFIFAEVPAATTWIGAATIVAAAWYVARHEARRRRRTAP